MKYCVLCLKYFSSGHVTLALMLIEMLPLDFMVQFFLFTNGSRSIKSYFFADLKNDPNRDSKSMI